MRYGIWDIKYETWNTVCRKLNTRSGMWDTERGNARRKKWNINYNGTCKV